MQERIEPRRFGAYQFSEARAIYPPGTNEEDRFTYTVADLAGNISNQAQVEARIEQPGRASHYGAQLPGGEFVHAVPHLLALGPRSGGAGQKTGEYFLAHFQAEVPEIHK